tara:strand:- start:797 stop:1192 length:396 start_codon:yes stop_codon:yes gene_type:complete
MEDKSNNIIVFLTIVFLIVLLSFSSEAQTIVNDKTFNKTKYGISVVEFWSDWNKENECFWIDEIKDAKPFRIDLETQTAEDFDIKVLPTIIVFNNGEEVDRFEGNISFELCPKRTPKKVQKIIDELMINKF